MAKTKPDKQTDKQDEPAAREVPARVQKLRSQDPETLSPGDKLFLANYEFGEAMAKKPPQPDIRTQRIDRLYTQPRSLRPGAPLADPRRVRKLARILVTR